MPGRNSRKEHGDRNLSKDHEGVLLSGSFGYLCYAAQAHLPISGLCPLITIANKDHILQTHPQGDLIDTTLL